MDTLSQVITRLDQEGWTAQLEVRAQAIRCVECGESAPPERHRIDHIERFEGSSDPADQAVVFALTSPNGHRGTLVTAFGPDAPPNTADAIRTMGQSSTQDETHRG